MSRKILISLFLATTLALTRPTVTHAIGTPNFSSCDQPTGEVRVSYTDGTHGIVGRSETYTGSDIVYTVSNGVVLQCYCPSEGTGIQTEWWNVASVPNEDVDRYKREGWIFVPTGALWGLDDAPYLAKNSDISCGEKGAGGGGDILGDTILPQILGDTGAHDVQDRLMLLGVVLLMAGYIIWRNRPSR